MIESEHIDYDGCDWLFVATVWVSECGFIVHNSIMRRELSGAEEERLLEAHQKHHANSIGERVGA